jgi:hypothetical protein
MFRAVPLDFLPEPSCRGDAHRRDNKTRSKLLIAGLAITRGNVPRFRFHPITPVCSRPPFPRQGLHRESCIEVVA